MTTETDTRGKVLNACVTVENPETGQPETFGPPDTFDASGNRINANVPNWAREAITNPNVWVDRDDLAEPEPVPGPGQSVHFDPESVDEDETEGSDQTPASRGGAAKRGSRARGARKR